MGPLYKTTIVIWSKYDGGSVELEDLAEDAQRGAAYCSKQDSKLIQDPGEDQDWDGTEFFETELRLGT